MDALKLRFYLILKVFQRRTQSIVIREVFYQLADCGLRCFNINLLLQILYISIYLIKLLQLFVTPLVSIQFNSVYLSLKDVVLRLWHERVSEFLDERTYCRVHILFVAILIELIIYSQNLLLKCLFLSFQQFFQMIIIFFYRLL